MANRKYPGGSNRFARGEILWRANGGSIICAFLVDASYEPGASDEFLSDVPTDSRHGDFGRGERSAAPTLALFDPAGGVCDAEDLTFARIPASEMKLTRLVLFADQGTDETSPLIALIDTGVGLPVAPNGADLEVIWSNGKDKILRL